MATIISSWGATESNCYIAWEDANTYIRDSVIDITDWAQADRRKQEAALIQATLDVDSRQYVGSRYYSDQKLEFPRQMTVTYPWDRTGTALTNTDAVQARCKSDVERACCVQALSLLRSAGRNSHNELMAAGVSEMTRKAGPVEETYKYSGTGNARVLCNEALELLSPWMTNKRVLRG